MLILKRTGIDLCERKLISKLYMDQRVKVQLDRGKTRNVQIGRGVRQGCCLSPILFNQKQLENVECCIYLGSMLTNNGRCTCEIKSWIAMAKAAFDKKKTIFTSKLDLNLSK